MHRLVLLPGVSRRSRHPQAAARGREERGERAADRHPAAPEAGRRHGNAKRGQPADLLGRVVRKGPLRHYGRLSDPPKTCKTCAPPQKATPNTGPMTDRGGADPTQFSFWLKDSSRVGATQVRLRTR